MNVAVVGDHEDVRRAVAAACDVVASPSAADVVVTAGESALLSAVETARDQPILPVASRPGPYSASTAATALSDALAAVADGTFETAPHPVLSVSVDGERVAEAAMDVSVMTSEPARISEFSVTAGGKPKTSVRADGVVVATPLGSAGYARDAGGPVLAPGTGLSVVPVAPYATRTDVWVCPADVSLSVERDDAGVSLYADADVVSDVSVGDAVRVRSVRTVALVRPPGG